MDVINMLRILKNLKGKHEYNEKKKIKKNGL